MEKKDIKIGIITEKELVELYGSENLKKSYSENGRFVSNFKKGLLTKLGRYCSITDLGDRRYRVTKVYEYPIPQNFNKMQKSLYQYICPLLLDCLINGHDKNHSIEITIGKWAREINMVNANYHLVKYNKEASEYEFGLDGDAVNDFYEKADEMVEYYITNSLDYLKAAGLIIWREVYKVSVEVTDNMCEIDKDGNVRLDLRISTHQASKDEMDYYAKCIKVADEAAGINNASERYYSEKAKCFGRVLKEELYKRKIKGIYKAYEAYYINSDKCDAVLKMFGVTSINKLVKNFNSEFTGMILGNTEKRLNKKSPYAVTGDSKEEYLLNMKNLCDITINKNTEYLGERILESKSILEKEKDTTSDYRLVVGRKKN